MPLKMPNITVYRGPGRPGSYTWSAFVTKLETRLRFAHIKYDTQTGSLSESPKGKIPYIRIESESETGLPPIMSDSTLIIQNLVGAGLAQDLNAELTPAKKAIDLAIRALLEDKIYYMTVGSATVSDKVFQLTMQQGYERWIENFYVMRDVGPLSGIPYPVRILVGYLAHSKLVRTLHGQGTGRYSKEELTSLRREAWSSLDDLAAEASRSSGKGPKWILGGEKPTEADACLHGFVASTLSSPA